MRADLARRKRTADSDGAAPSAEERAYLYIRSQILNGEFRPGSRLPEETVARQIGLSRTPVRGALHRLVTEGLIEFRRNVGAIVRILPAEEIDQLLQVRVVMEGLAAELAAQFASEEMIARLDVLCKEMVALASRDIPDLMHIARLNNEFHFLLISSCGNIHVRRIAENLGNLNVTLRSYSIYSRTVLRRSMGHHAELVEALKARNPRWARAVMTAHIESTRSVASADKQPRSDVVPAEELGVVSTAVPALT
jgi:DNA-binding GntR family transcriptional regulator